MPWENARCRLCDGLQSRKRSEATYWDQSQRSEDCKRVIATLRVLVQDVEFQKSTRPRIMMAMAIYRDLQPHL